MGSENPKNLVLPYNVPANEFMNLEGRKISGSKNWAIWGLDVLERYDADAIRYYLTSAMPETRDSDWDWEEFFQRNNNELVATWGNLVNRVLAFTYKNWDGQIPQPESLRNSDRELLATIQNGFKTVAEKIEAVELKAAMSEAMGLATEVNKYLDTHAPWFEIKTDRAEAEKSVFTAIQAIDWLKLMLAPFLPHISESLNQILDYDLPLFGEPASYYVQDDLGIHKVLTYKAGLTGQEDRWVPGNLVGGRPFNQPTPLVKKLDHSMVEEERARMGKVS